METRQPRKWGEKVSNKKLGIKYPSQQAIALFSLSVRLLIFVFMYFFALQKYGTQIWHKEGAISKRKQ